MTMGGGPGVVAALTNLRYPRSLIQHLDFPNNPWQMSTRDRDDTVPPLWQALPWLPYTSLWPEAKIPESTSDRIGFTASNIPSRTTNGDLPPESPSLPIVPPLDPVAALKALEANPVITRALASTIPRRQRSEKKPIPDDMKDSKYYERRKRNNIAAKKSRDARKAREDEIALRACFLEKENAILRAQVTTLREEAQSLRQLLIHKRHNRLC